MGLIGAGTMGRMYAGAFTQSASAELVAVCDLDGRKARALGRAFGVKALYEDYAEMLRAEELDAVTVATPDRYHRKPAVGCLRAGMHVLCEKPLATTMADCRAIRDAVRKYDRRLMVNFGNRHKMQTYAMKGRLDAGELGPIENAFIQLREPIHKTRTLAWAADTTPTFFLLSHCTDTVLYLIGGQVREVYARANYGVLKARGLDTPDCQVAMLGLDSGATVVMDANWIMPDGFARGIDFTLELIGQKGTIYTAMRSHDMEVSVKKAEAPDYDGGGIDPLGRRHGWWINSVNYFIECLERGVEPRPGAEEGMEVTRVLLAIEQSCRTGKVVKL
ncbi:MAG: Gfo/Idh/MocA family oxidoreductase [Candidatus Brocadiaceae bacterium]|nr:Gfo/Idh/MocA family oxidoreductase [Candidatus Brocadiaceae bacterium]